MKLENDLQYNITKKQLQAFQEAIAVAECNSNPLAKIELAGLKSLESELLEELSLYRGVK